MPKFSTSPKKLIAILLAAVQALTPIAASASQYIQLMHVKDLKVLNGEGLPIVNVDPSNTSTTLFPAGASVLKATPSAIDFGPVPVGGQSPLQTITFSNLGASPAVLGVLSINDQFTVTNNCDGVTLPSLGTCQINVTFAPTQVALGGVLGTVVIPFSSGGINATALLGVRGVALAPVGTGASALLEGFSGTDPALTYDLDNKAQIQFQSALVGQDPVIKTFTLRSNGTAPLSISSIQFANNDGSFALATSCGSVLQPGAGCAVTVTFTPLTAGAKNSTFNIRTTSINGNVIPVKVLAQVTSDSALELSTASLPFGLVPIGTPLSKTVVVTNTGVSMLTTPAIHVSGQYYSATHNCPFSLAREASCVVTVTLTPPVPAVFNGQLSVTYAGTGAQSVPLSGKGFGPQIFADTSSLGFGKVAVGTSASRTVTITNEGTAAAPLTFGAVPAGVTETTDCPASLAVDAVCHLVVTYTPTVPGTLTGTQVLSTTSNSVTLQIAGTAVWPTSYSLSATTLEFGNQPVSTTGTQSFDVLNTGNGAIEGLILTMGANSPVFGPVSNCPASIVPGTSCQVFIQFTPTQRGAASNHVTVVVPGATSRQVMFSGTGLGAVLSAAPASLSFGTMVVGQSRTVTSTVSNTGDLSATLSIGSVPANMTRAGTCATELAPGAFCTLELAYTPLAAQTLGGSLSIASNTSSTQLSYSGTSVEPRGMVLSTHAVAFGTVAFGTHNVATVDVLNGDAYPLTLNSISVLGSYQASHNCPTSLAAGDTCQVTIAYEATRYVNQPGSVSVGFDGIPTQIITLSGRGTGPYLVASASSLDFETLYTGTSASKSLTLRNDGDGAANLNFGTLPSTVTRAGNCSSTLASDATCTVTLQYHPTSPQTLGATLTVSAPLNNVSVNLVGTALQATHLSVSASGLDMGVTPVNTPVVRTFNILNDGVVPVGAPSVAVTGSRYTASHNCPATFGVGASCSVQVTFNPIARGNYPGYVEVSVPGSSALQVALQGVAQGAVLLSNFPDQSFGGVNVGSSSSLSYVLNNTGELDAAVSYSSLPRTIARAGTCSTLIAAGTSCTVTLTFTPTALGSVSGGLTLASATSNLVATYAGTGIGTPTFGLSTTALDFANTTIYTTTQQSFQVNNTGFLDLVSTAIVSTNGAYGLTHNCPQTLSAGTSCLVTVTFAPTIAQSYPGTVDVRFSGVSAQTVTLTGSGFGTPSFSLSSTSTDFGNVSSGSTVQRTVVLTNTGNIAIVSPSVIVSGAGFSVTNNCGTSVAAGATCSAVLTFAPSARQAYTGTLSVSFAHLSTKTNALGGAGVTNPSVALSTSSVPFGSVNAASTAQLSVTVTNDGNTAVSTPAVSATGAGFSATHNCPTTLATAATCTVVVAFSPTAGQAYSGTLSVGYTGTMARTASLSGTGIALPAATLSSSAVAFGSNLTGSTPTRTVTVTNTGNVPLTLSSLATTGAAFSASHNCGTSLAVGANCITTVTFAPTANQAYSGVLSVALTGISVKSATLSGTGALPAYAGTITPKTLSPGGTSAGWVSAPNVDSTFVLVPTNGTRVSNSTDTGVTWVDRTAGFTSGQWVKAEYGNGVLVLLSSTSTSAYRYSVDGGISWGTGALPASGLWYGLTYGNGLFVATVYGGSTAATSPDGVNWTLRTLPGTGSWQTLTYGANGFVATAYSSTKTATSPDGSVWTIRATAMPSVSSWIASAYGNGVYVVLATSSNKLMVSSDGVSFTESTMPSPNWAAVTFGNGVFMAVGPNKIATSTDGLNWVQQALTGTFGTVSYGNGSFVIPSNSLGTGYVLK